MDFAGSKKFKPNILQLIHQAYKESGAQAKEQASPDEPLELVVYDVLGHLLHFLEVHFVNALFDNAVDVYGVQDIRSAVLNETGVGVDSSVLEPEQEVFLVLEEGVERGIEKLFGFLADEGGDRGRLQILDQVCDGGSKVSPDRIAED